MSKGLRYTVLLAVSMIVGAVFVTAETYLQLGLAIILYLVLVYFILKVTRRGKPRVYSGRSKKLTSKSVVVVEEQKMVADAEKRDFLKMIGAFGLSFFLFSIIGKKPGMPLLSNLVGRQSSGSADPAIRGDGSISAEGYRISEIDDGAVTYYGFTHKSGAWFIMKEDTDSGSFRYVKGDSNFSNNWENRAKLKYDYYHKVF